MRTILVCLFVAAFFVGEGSATWTGPAGPTDLKAAPVARTSLQPKGESCPITMRGTISFYDRERRELMLQADEVSYLVLIAPDATILRDDVPIRAESLQRGDRAVLLVQMEEDQPPTALRVEVGPAEEL